MARTKCKKQTKHGLFRMHTRCNLSNKYALSMIKAASTHGFSPGHFKEGPFKLFLLKKENKRNKRIKVYKGIIFIFNQTSNKLITAYNIPKKYIDEFNSFTKDTDYLNY